MTKADFLNKLRDRFSPDEIDETGLEDFLIQALDRYNKDSPRRCILSLAGNGTAYEWSLPDWDTSLSYLLSVEYPAERRIPVFLKRDYYIVVESDGSFKLRFLYATPSAAEKVEVVYATAHTVDDTKSTVPLPDFYAVVDFGSSLIARFLASKYFRAAETYEVYQQTIDFGRKGENYIALAKAWEASYNNHVQRKLLVGDRIEPVSTFLERLRQL